MNPSGSRSHHNTIFAPPLIFAFLLLLLTCACTTRRPEPAAAPATLAPAAGLPDAPGEASVVALAVALPPTFTPVSSPTTGPTATSLPSGAPTESPSSLPRTPAVPEATRIVEPLSGHPPGGWPAIRAANGLAVYYPPFATATAFAKGVVITSPAAGSSLGLAVEIDLLSDDVTAWLGADANPATLLSRVLRQTYGPDGEYSTVLEPPMPITLNGNPAMAVTYLFDPPDANGPILTYNAALIQDGRYGVGIWAGSGDPDLALPYLKAIAANIVVNP